jgi:restriction system protein
MALPKYYEMQFPILKLIGDDKVWKLSDVERPLGEFFKLNEDEYEIMYSSGNGPVFFDRIGWALSYLNMAGLISKPKRGFYQINDLGKKVLQKPESFRDFMTENVNKKNTIKSKSTISKEQVEEENVSFNETTPEETLYESFQGIKKSIFREIIDTILSKTPREFEKLVVLLLQKMGYGGEVKDSGIVTQHSNDKGIDGVIKEDILGFGRIYIQAKRFAIDNNVSREDVQKFVGALAVAQSEKGVFITTSDFTKGAYEYVKSLNSTTKIVLINGEQLAQYIYDYNLGMQLEHVIEIKKMDSDFWDSMQDN